MQIFVTEMTFYTQLFRPTNYSMWLMFFAADEDPYAGGSCGSCVPGDKWIFTATRRHVTELQIFHLRTKIFYAQIWQTLLKPSIIEYTHPLCTDSETVTVKQIPGNFSILNIRNHCLRFTSAAEYHHSPVKFQFCSSSGFSLSAIIYFFIFYHLQFYFSITSICYPVYTTASKALHLLLTLRLLFSAVEIQKQFRYLQTLKL